jgi:thioesterase domain-containing protein
MTPIEVAGTLEASGDAVTQLLTSIPPPIARWKPAPSEWCVNECVGHLIEAELRAFAGRIRVILENQEPALQAWDAAEVARTRDDCSKDPAELRDEFNQLREESLVLVRSLQPEQLRRGGMHPQVSRLTVNELIHEWVHHDANHLRQAYANVEAYVWPQMGNTRNFSSG